MGSALPADTEASDTPDSVYREQFRRSSSFGCDCVWGIRIAGLGMLTSGLTVNPQLSADTFSATVIIRADTSDSTYERTAGASFCKSCLATIAK